MKSKIFIITILVMMLSAVQVYAQRERGGGRSSTTRVERRSSSTIRQSTPQRTRSYATPSRTTTRTTTISRTTTTSRRSVRSSVPQRRDGVVTSPSQRISTRPATVTNRNSVRSSNNSWRYERVSGLPSPTRTGVAQRDARRSETRSGMVSRHAPAPSRHVGPAPRRHLPPPPPPHRPWRPIFHHHHSYMHHHYHCVFDRWYWYNWGGYHNRFICHRLYHNRFFDSLLGYYIWGALDAPTRLDIGNMTLTRYNSTLKVQIGTSVSYLDLYRSQTAIYRSGYTSIEVATGNGSALVRFYDEYGNEATYRL